MKIISFFENLGNFLYYGWKGLVAGLIVGIVFLILMKIFVFKNKGVGNIVALLIILPCMIGGMFISNTLFKPKIVTAIPVQTIAGTTIADPTKYLTITANGGFDKSYIELAEADPNCPVAEDKNFNINMVEYKDSVIIYYLNAEDNIFYNSILDKTDNGLTFTGCFDVEVDTYSKWSWQKFGFIKIFKPSLYSTFINNMSKQIEYAPLTNQITEDNGSTYLNLFGKDKEITPGYYSITHEPTVASIEKNRRLAWPYNKTSSKEITELDMQTAQLGCYDVYQYNFQQLNDFGIKCTEETVFSDMNSFYNVVYKSTSENENDTLVTVTDLVGDVKDGIVYKSNRFVNVDYLDISDTNAFAGNVNENAKEYIEVDPTDDTLTAVSNPIVKISLINENNSDLTNFNILNTPVVINLKNKATNLSYNYTFDTINELNTCIERALPFGNYNYTILSTTLDFNGTNGVLNIDKDNISFIFNYSYSGNYLNASIKLNPIDNVDLLNFNIADNPVTITLTNKDNTSLFYTYVFNNQTSFDNGITKNMLIGSYTYTINSNALTFAEITGEFDFDINSTNIAFNYDYKSNENNLSIENIEVPSLYGQESHLSILKESSINQLEFNIQSVKMINKTYNTFEIKENYISSSTENITYNFNLYYGDEYAIQITYLNEEKISITSAVLDIEIFKTDRDHGSCTYANIKII